MANREDRATAPNWRQVENQQQEQQQNQDAAGEATYTHILVTF